MMYQVTSKLFIQWPKALSTALHIQMKMLALCAIIKEKDC